MAVSGGADSMALLHATWRQAQALGLRLVGLHVHHGLQPAAEAWPDFIRAECARWARQQPAAEPVRIAVRHLEGRPGKGQSVEEWARVERRKALIEMAQEHGADLLLLAQHQQDQAETFMLQALRGVGPQGLAGMARDRVIGGVRLVRPWLEQPRDSVRGYAQRAGLRWIEDPSNVDERYARNRLRQRVWPMLEAAFPQAAATLAASASRCAQALPALEEGVRLDLERCARPVADDPMALRVDRELWGRMPVGRRTAALRGWLAGCGVRRPTAALVERVAREMAAGSAARWKLPGDQGELQWYREVLRVQADRQPTDSNAAPAPASMELRWTRAGRRHLPEFGGSLVLRRAGPQEDGLAQSLPLVCHLRPRESGDRFQLARQGLARSLKKQFQEAGVASWSRRSWVVVDALGAMLLIPGLGLDARRTRAGGRWVLEWEPSPHP